MTSDELNDFASRYAKAWCSQNPEKVAAFYAKGASISVRDFPDMIVTFDKVGPRGDRTAFHWTLTGAHVGTGNHVRISGYELWKFNDAGLIAESSGHFDAAEYERQVNGTPAL